MPPCHLTAAAGPVHPRGPATSEVVFSLVVAWTALRALTAAVFVVLCGPCLASSRWPSTAGPRGRGPTRTRTCSPSSCRHISGTDTRRPRGRSGRRRPRHGAASSALAGCFKAVAVAVVVVVLVAMQERCKSLLPCECFTACLPAACHVHTFLCLMKYCYLQAPCCCPLPCCLPSSCAGMLRTWLTYRGGAFPQGPP